MQALIDASHKKNARLHVVLVISNVKDAPALAKATHAGISTATISHREPDFEEAMHHALQEAKVELIVLAGFMRILTAGFLAKWPNRVINVHPALCPAFPGIHAAKQAVDYGVKISGCTVHFVDAGIDSGPIISQKAVPVYPQDDADALQRRIQKEEHRLLPKAVRELAKCIRTNTRDVIFSK